MNRRTRSMTLAIAVLAAFGLFALGTSPLSGTFDVRAQTSPSPGPKPVFDQAAVLAKLREQIKGKENEPAPSVFKNIQTMKNTPAGRLLAVMEMGYSKSLGVDCTHCHVPDKWDSEEKPQKQIARDMSAMVSTLNRDLLKNIKNLKSEAPLVNCTTCHRGEVKPALNLPAVK